MTEPDTGRLADATAAPVKTGAAVGAAVMDKITTEALFGARAKTAEERAQAAKERMSAEFMKRMEKGE